MKRCWYGVIVFVIVLFLTGFVAAKFLLDDKVYVGVAVDGVPMHGLTEAEVADLLRLWHSPGEGHRFSAYCDEIKFSFDPETVDYDVDVNATAEEVFRLGRNGSFLERLKVIVEARTEGCPIPLKIRYNEQKMADLIETWRESIDKPAKNAGMSMLHGGMVSAQSGLKLETAATKSRVLETLGKGNQGSMALPVTPLYPEKTAVDIACTGLQESLANFATFFNVQDHNRSTNIQMAANKINGYIIYPCQTFSFNDVVGPRDKEHGFKEAMEIVGNKYVPGIGGGICQVSSTLYNAVLLANLTVSERYNHSKPLGYVDLGRDATVAYGVLDFKFTNNTQDPVMIVSEIQDNELCIGLFGVGKNRNETVKVVTENKQVISPTVVRKSDQTMYLGETALDKQGTPGYEVTTVRVVRRRDGEIKREIIATDKYPPENTVVKIGTRMPDFF